jgi:uncharacterized protein
MNAGGWLAASPRIQAMTVAAVAPQNAAAPRNRLATTNSPYLLAHADNPVDWYPWGDEALSRATREDKPILLSIGYLTCHWCHVMEHESFRDPQIADFMNRHFICIKVDREERPDIDQIYMTATMALCGQGGWPMTVFLTPSGEAFFAGTYFPHDDDWGRPGFGRVLQSVANVWRSARPRVVAEGRQIAEHLRAVTAPDQPQPLTLSLLDTALAQLSASFDPEWGGFDAAPKFPPHAALRFLADGFVRDGSKRCLEMYLTTLDKIQAGGIHDHLAGGFARYSTDARWQIPHFEKMLYDNAQLAKAFLFAYRVTRAESYRDTLERLLKWIETELGDPGGGFYTGLDADSEGEEGRFYLFDWNELRQALPPQAAEAVRLYYDIKPEGNWEGHNVLWTPRSRSDVARQLGVDEAILNQQLLSARDQLNRLRAARPRPQTDDKILAGQTGLALSAFAEAGRVLDDRHYLGVAEKAAQFVLHTLLGDDGRLVRVARLDKVGQPAMLDDYAYLAEGLLTLYEATGHADHLLAAERLTQRLISDFYDNETQRVYHSPAQHEALLLRLAEGQDGQLPNPTAIAAEVLVRLSDHCARPEWRQLALTLIQAHGKAAQRFPRGHTDLLRVARYVFDSPTKIIVVPGTDIEASQAVWRACAQRTFAGQTLAFLPEQLSAVHCKLPLFEGRTTIQSEPQVYICRDQHCEAPVHTVADVDKVLPMPSPTI